MLSLSGALGFLTTIPVGRNYESFEAFRRRIYIMPLAGAIVGLVCGVICFILGLLSLNFLAPLAVLSVEGINHLDGLSDFGDAVFAHGERKLKALKDLNTGVGGTFTVTLWCLCVALTAWKLKPSYLLFTTFTAEVSAKSCMLLILSTSEPLWEGMGKYMMEFASPIKSLMSVFVAGIAMTALQYYLKYPFLYMFLISVTSFLFVRAYSLRVFGGVNGDVVGATNSISIAICFICSYMFRWWLY